MGGRGELIGEALLAVWRGKRFFAASKGEGEPPGEPTIMEAEGEDGDTAVETGRD